MGQYIVRRLLLTLPVLFGVVVLVFFLAHLVPGSQCRALLGERATTAQCAAFDKLHGLDQPIPVQFVRYIGDVAHGDFGSSIKTGLPVTQLLMERLPVTVELSLFALVFAIGFGILFGVVSAYRRNSAVDVITMAGANIGVSIPIFVLGLILAWFFALVLKGTPFALPPSGRLTPGVEVVALAQRWHLEGLTGPPRAFVDFISNMYTLNALLTGQWSLFFDAVKHLILPAVALGTIPLAIIARITRSSLLDVLGLDYIRTARAKGLSNGGVVRRHALPNAMLPVVTIIGIQLGGLLGGAVLTETIFNLSGVGRAVSESILSRDYSVVQGFVLIIAIGYLILNLLVDLSYGFLDPRVRLR